MPYQVLKKYESLFLSIKDDLEQISVKNQQNKFRKDILTELGASILKTNANIPKYISRSTANMISPKNSFYLHEIERNFNSTLNNFMNDLSNISINNKLRKINSEKLKSKFNMVYKVSKLDTKIVHVLNKITELLNLNLVFNENLIKKHYKDTKKIDYFIDYPKFREIFSDNLLIDFLKKEGLRGESSIIEFKRDYNVNKMERIATVICSMANTNSGILFFGWDENRRIFHRVDIEKIEQQIIQLIRNNISPPLEYIIHKINNNEVKGLLLAIPFTGEIFSVNNKTPIRKGSHLGYLNASEIINYNKKIHRKRRGYLQLFSLKKQFKIV